MKAPKKWSDLYIYNDSHIIETIAWKTNVCCGRQAVVFVGVHRNSIQVHLYFILAILIRFYRQQTLYITKCL